MRALLLPIVVHGALVAAGLGILRALGVIPGLRSRRALAAAGLAYLVGVVATLGIGVIVLVAGGPFTLPVFALIAGVLAAPLVLWRRAGNDGGEASGRRPELIWQSWRQGRSASDWAVIATLAALAVLLIVGLLTLGNRPLGPADVDAWNQWTRKALLLTGSSHLPTVIFGFSGDFRPGPPGPHYNINASYPLLLPLLEALHLRALGRADPAAVHISLWLLATAFAWAGGLIASRVTRAAVWAPVLAGATALSLPALLTGYADVPLAYYMGLGCLELGVWLSSEQTADLLIAVLLLAGAASIKNEGTAGAVLVLVVALVLKLARRERGAARRLAVIAAPMMGLAIAPWRIWVAAHHLQTEEPLARTVDPGYLISHIGRVGPALSGFVAQLGRTNGVTVFVAVALAMAAVFAVERRHRMLTGFYLIAGLGYMVALIWAVWISTLPLSFDVAHSADRVVVVPAFIAVAALLQLSGWGPDRPPDTGPPARAP